MIILIESDYHNLAREKLSRRRRRRKEKEEKERKRESPRFLGYLALKSVKIENIMQQY